MRKLLALLILSLTLSGCFGIPKSTMIFDGIWYAIHTVPVQAAKQEEKKN